MEALRRSLDAVSTDKKKTVKAELPKPAAKSKTVPSAAVAGAKKRKAG